MGDVDMVLAWLEEPAATRPRLATLYFEHLDHAAHTHGPDSPEALATLAELEGTPGVRVLRHDAPFNYSAINNAAARVASDLAWPATWPASPWRFIACPIDEAISPNPISATRS